MTGHHPAAYAEAHSALNAPLLTLGLLPLAAEIACLVLGITANMPWCFVLMGPLFVLVLISVGLLYRSWPTGLHVDEAGIRIGAVGSSCAARRRPTVSHQSWGLFSCPWRGVQDVRVVTDPEALRELKTGPRYYTLTNRWSNKAGMKRCNQGVLSSPFMRAALVLEVDPFEVTASEIRPARYYSNFKDGQFSHVIESQLSPVLVVPTRRPRQLRAALEAASDAWRLARRP
jgi:hypothetical protein